MYRLLLCCCSVVSIAVLSCKPFTVFNGMDGPRYYCNEYSETRSSEYLTLLSFNTGSSADHLSLLDELGDILDFAQLDIIIFQEADELVVRTISDMYQLNYIYYPMSESGKGVKFGNCILSKYKISATNKFILPGKKINGRIRNATNCVVSFGDHEVLVYAVHNETIVMPQRKRWAQLVALLDTITRKSNSYETIIVGGDFNSVFSPFNTRLSDEFTRRGFYALTEDIPYTSFQFKGLIKLKLDHVFAKGIGREVESVRALDKLDASDHLPILCKVRVQQ